MSAHPIFWLVFVTMLCVIAFAGWSFLSTKRHEQTGGKTSGLGGPNDPLG